MPEEKNLRWWTHGIIEPFSNADALKDAIYYIQRPFNIIVRDNAYAVGLDGTGLFGRSNPAADAFPVAAHIPACRIESLGDRTFCVDHGLRYPYIAGSMAHGITSPEMVEAMGLNGMLGFFGSSGMDIEAVESAIDRITGRLAGIPHGYNLIHSPNDPALEAALTDLYLRRGIKLVEASAYMDLTLPVVRFRVHGIHRNSSGDIATPNRIIAKVSRVEVASRFFAPPPDALIRELVCMGDITEEQANLASQVPMAQDITAEADSGGHTDNQSAMTLLPTILALRDRMQDRYSFSQALRVGVAGGIATPSSASAAFAMGAAYILTGSINQACIESGTSDDVKEMLALTEQADVTMAPAADMFEMGVTVQVIKRGTMFPMRASKLYEIYRSCNGIQEIPAGQRMMLEKSIFQDSLENVWKQTRNFFLRRDPAQVERAEKDAKHLMALVFRWYLGKSSQWATTGDVSRKIDYQIWCGPSMGAFNEWAKGSFLEHPQNRKVDIVALNLLFGASVVMRINHLRWQGIPFPPDLRRVTPMDPSLIKGYLN